MAVAHTTVLELLGKQVSFIHSLTIDSDVHFSDCSGIVTDVVISLSGEPSISINEGDFYLLSNLLEFRII